MSEKNIQAVNVKTSGVTINKRQGQKELRTWNTSWGGQALLILVCTTTTCIVFPLVAAVKIKKKTTTRMITSLPNP